MDKRPINFTRFNIIYASIVILGGFAFLAYMTVKFPNLSPKASGYILGRSIGYVFWTAVAAIIVWLISGRSPRSASITFNWALSLFLISGFVNFVSGIDLDATSNRSNFEAASERIQSDYAKFLEDPDADPGDLEAIQAKALTVLDQMGNVGDENLKKSVAVTKVFVKKTMQLESDFTNATNSIDIVDFFEPAGLLDPTLFAINEGLLVDFIAITRTLIDHHAGMEEFMRSEMKLAGVDEDYREKFIRGGIESTESRMALIHEVYSLHLRHVESVLSIYTLLGKDRDLWQFDKETDLLIFDDDDLRDTYTRKIDELIVFEDVFDERLPELAEKLIETF